MLILTYIFFESIENQGLQLAKAFVYSGSAPFLHDWL